MKQFSWRSPDVMQEGSKSYKTGSEKLEMLTRLITNDMDAFTSQQVTSFY